MTVELCCGDGVLGDSIKSPKEYSTPLLLIFATLVSEVGFYKTNTPTKMAMSRSYLVKKIHEIEVLLQRLGEDPPAEVSDRPTVPVHPAAMQEGCQPKWSTLTADE